MWNVAVRITKVILALVIVPIAIALVLVFAFLARPLLFVLVVLALPICPVLYFTSPRFRAWLKQGSPALFSCNGLRLAIDIALHPTHSWARIAADHVDVGADDLLQATLGPVEHVELPPVGSRVGQGDRLFSLQRGNRRVEVKAPVSGTVVTRNEALLQHPNLVNEMPFTEGWAVRLRAEDLGADTPRLIRGKFARGWFRRETDRLLAAVLTGPAMAHCLPDGGTLVSDLYRQIDDKAWNGLTESFFASGSES
jgi:glycine cleavage system H lipoate-binding protein